MKEISNVVPLRHPDEIDDPLTNILRTGARQLLAQAVEVEAESFLAAMKDLKLADGRDRVVRHGHGPTRTIQTGIGPVRRGALETSGLSGSAAYVGPGGGAEGCAARAPPGWPRSPRPSAIVRSLPSSGVARAEVFVDTCAVLDLLRSPPLT